MASISSTESGGDVIPKVKSLARSAVPALDIFDSRLGLACRIIGLVNASSVPGTVKELKEPMSSGGRVLGVGVES